MAVSKRVALAASAATMGVGLLAVLVATPLLAGSAAAATTTGGCSATAHIDAQWGSGSSGGEVLSVTVANTATTTATKWTVSWALAGGQQVLSAWNATVSTSSGVVTAVNMPYNGTLAPGATTSFGMQVAGTAPAPVLSCGNDAIPPSSPPASSASSSGPPPSGADVTVTTVDTQTTVTLVLGQTLGVSLPANFRQPTENGTALTQLSSTGGYPTGQPVAALFRATAVGSATLDAHTDAACFYTTPPCAMPVQLWTVRVNVVNAPPAGRTVTVTVADNFTTVSLHLGDTLVVSLAANYDPPTVNPGGVLVRSALSGGYPTDQPLVAKYLAVAPGPTDVSTSTDAQCAHQPTPCPTPFVMWKLHVQVS